MGITLALAACGGPAAPVGVVGHVEGFAGLVAADEPRAALAGRDVLSAGGTPADAVVAMAFVMAVTMPSQVSLGAGGSCLAYDHDKSKVEALEFIAPPPQRLAVTTTRPSAVPALPRGLYALYSKYGHLRWEQLIAPAEGMARLGVPASRAFVAQLAPVAGPLFEDAESRRLFAQADGQPLGEGQMLVQADLGASLARLRSRGVGEFYTGSWSNEIVDAFRRAGASLESDELRAFIPRWAPPMAVAYGNETAYFPPPPASAGLLEAQYWSLLAGNGAYADADAATRLHLLAEVFARGYEDRAQWLNPDGTTSQSSDTLLSKAHLQSLMAGYSPSSHQPWTGQPLNDVVAGTGLVAVDASGNAVACNIGLNNLFGIGRVVPDTGILPAAAPGMKGRGPYAMGPMLALNTNSNEFRFAGAAAGGPTAATALIEVALASLVGDQPLDRAVAAKRLFASGGPDAVFVEPGFSDAAALTSRGHELHEMTLPSRVNAARCTSGDPKPSRCRVVTDPRGAGLAIEVGQN